MADKLYLNSIDLTGEYSPSWSNIPNDTWRTILEEYFYKISDSFAFMNVYSENDLSPKYLDFFKNWNLEKMNLVEVNDDIVCRFKLNDDCKERLLRQDFSVHEIGMFPPRNIFEYDEKHYYYEFDELYFFSGNKLIGIFINHENMIQFENLNEQELVLLQKLDKSISIDIIDEAAFQKCIQDRHVN
ncbi:hypothetical protein [Hymenobacter profundi]|uniref:Uncharacterized protein n=1 Tax=Hymenobacter profundi TaxID=1982110 RepID=A0ABS6WZB6_9BACT|nr:hypothetical protein [Hymenobacter profundi]MBW3128934.1 hypothetical protein [Hymenobacter profundi]